MKMPAGKEIAIDFAVMISIWLVGMLMITAFCYGIAGYAVPQYVTDYCETNNTTPHAMAQFGYIIVIIVGLIVFFVLTIVRRMT